MNGDYKISGAGNENSDLQYLGDSNPHFVFGFTLGGSWKGIDVNAMFQGVGKQYVIRNDWMAYPFQTRTANQNPTYLGKTWTESNPNAEFPRLTTNANLARWNYQNNDFMMQNNRYIRLKTLIVGYTLPQIWTRKVKLEKYVFTSLVMIYGKLPVFETVSTRKWEQPPTTVDTRCTYLVVRSEHHFIVAMEN